MDKVTFNTVYNRKNELLANGTALIQIEAYLRGKKKYFSTRIYITPEQWDNDQRKIKAHPNKISLNKRIRDFITSLEEIETHRTNTGKPFTLDFLSQSLKGTNNNMFIDWCKREMITEKMSAKTRMDHICTFKHLEKFKKDTTFEDINFEYLKKFEYYLREKKQHQNTIVKHQTIIRRYVNLAINKEIIELNKYPFRKYKIEKQETHREYLTPEELVRFENIKLPEDKKYLQLALDKFIFAVYTGLRFGDVNDLKPDSLKMENGNEYLNLIMGKTKQQLKLPVFLPMFSKALDIFYSYAGKQTTVFPFQHNTTLNNMLKELATMAGINKTVTFHVARHTQATCLLYKGVNITTVQKLLGHKKIETTQIYAKVMNETIKKDLEKITSFAV